MTGTVSTQVALAPLNPAWLFRLSKAEVDVVARPSDGLVVFSVMWALAMMLSTASQGNLLNGDSGWGYAALTWGLLANAAVLIMSPRRTALLISLAALMLLFYWLRMPVSSNNQTIALFMNVGLIAVLSNQFVLNRGLNCDRDVAYEQLRVVARGLLATMYFYGVFHKINTGFFDPVGSCATALYEPLARPFGLENNIVGIYGAIAATFIVEAVAIICLYWRRFFWVGLIISLPFHYVIPISGFSWYMDFSSLVFALYMLSVPREVSAGLYSAGVAIVRRTLKVRAGTSALFALGITLAASGSVVLLISEFFPGRGLNLMWHSSWLLTWAVVGGAAMALITRAALLELPYSDARVGERQPWWVYAIPSALFVSCLSPYLGLKTESSIAMFSNLHTEGRVSNHLIFRSPPYFFAYQSRVARVLDSSDPLIRKLFANPRYGMIEHDIAMRLSGNPATWITYEIDGKRHERVTSATFDGDRPNWLERKLLSFKRVDWTRPKECTH